MLDVCVETYGSVAPVVGNDSVAAVLRLRALPGNRRPRALPRALPKLAAGDVRAVPKLAAGDLRALVMRAVDGLPFLLIQALWLVDTCRCSYEEAAAELSTTPEVVRQRVASARRTIRLQILDEPPD